ncbi:manganese efflux pump MntP family protein [Desulfosarcina sp. OttesenSCG-928-G17]|nr:manganese efflux pump MntP family protein [Desulfosarcina sp. OttesenSCG-928-G17]
MTVLSLLFLAIALAMDALAVSIAAGVALRTVTFRQRFRLSWHFGLFQAMMPVVGWAGGLTIRRHIEAYDHWIAFVLLIFVAQGMLRSAFEKKQKDSNPQDPTKGMILVMLSVATSIDALAVGFSLSLMHISIWMPALMIGGVAFLFTAIGISIGGKIAQANRLRRWAETIGGFVLLAIGLNILRTHGALSFL